MNVTVSVKRPKRVALRFVAIFTTIIAAILVVRRVQSLILDSPPKIEVAPNLVEFDGVEMGQSYTRRLSVDNHGGQTLVIESVRTGCGCIRTSLSGPNVVGPDDSVSLDVAIELYGDPGVIRKGTEIVLVTNDPENEFYRIPVMITPAKETSSRPSLIDFGVVAPADLPASRALVCSDEEPGVGEFSIVDSTSGITLESSGSTGEEHFQVEVPQGAEAGDFFAVILCGDPVGNIAREIVVRGGVKGPVFAVPPAMLIQCDETDHMGIQAESEVYFRSDGGSVAATGVSATVRDDIEGWLKVDAVSGNRVAVTLRRPATHSAMSTRRVVGEIGISSDYEGERATVRIPVIVEFRVRRLIE